ncbi:hypothetical protein D3C78_1911750 [compost metagenome]
MFEHLDFILQLETALDFAVEVIVGQEGAQALCTVGGHITFRAPQFVVLELRLSGAKLGADQTPR